jgi:hypothetical protein
MNPHSLLKHYPPEKKTDAEASVTKKTGFKNQLKV